MKYIWHMHIWTVVFPPHRCINQGNSKTTPTRDAILMTDSTSEVTKTCSRVWSLDLHVWSEVLKTRYIYFTVALHFVYASTALLCPDLHSNVSYIFICSAQNDNGMSGEDYEWQGNVRSFYSIVHILSFESNRMRSHIRMIPRKRTRRMIHSTRKAILLASLFAKTRQKSFRLANPFLSCAERLVFSWTK